MPKGGERKQNYFGTLIEYLTHYNQILLVGADNVGSSHMQAIRKSLRKRAVLLMGKNTMIRKAIRGHLTQNPELEAILPQIKGNVGFVFTNEDLKGIRDEIIANKLPAQARVGSVSPCDVHVPAGPTTMDPSQTGFMQALNIATRISKGTIEIINPVHLIKEGDKVGSSEAALLQKLDIRPFAYGLQPVAVYKEGSIFKPSILDITDENIVEKFSFGVQRIAALSLQINIPSITAVPHYFASAYKNVLAVAIATDYTFPRAEKIKNLLNDPEALAALAAAAAAPAASAAAPAAAAAPAKEEKKEEPEEEEEEDMGFGLFD